MMLLTLFLLMCVCVPLNYLTCEKSGAIKMQHNNNNTSIAFLTASFAHIYYILFA